MPLNDALLHSLGQSIDSTPSEQHLKIVDASSLVELRAIIVTGTAVTAARAAALAATVKDPRAVDVVLLAATRPQLEVRIAAAASAWQLQVGGQRVLKILLGDSDSGVARFAVRSTGRAAATHGTASCRTLQADLERTRERFPDLAVLVSCVQRFLEELPPTRAELLDALMSPWTAEDIASVLSDLAADVVLEIIETELGPLAAKAFRVASLGVLRADVAVKAAMRHPLSDVRREAAALFRKEPLTSELLLPLLQDEAREVRLEAIASASLYLEQVPVMQALTRYAEDDRDSQLQALAREAFKRRKP